jgi:hypothetical protein
VILEPSLAFYQWTIGLADVQLNGTSITESTIAANHTLEAIIDTGTTWI